MVCIKFIKRRQPKRWEREITRKVEDGSKISDSRMGWSSCLCLLCKTLRLIVPPRIWDVFTGKTGARPETKLFVHRMTARNASTWLQYWWLYELPKSIVELHNTSLWLFVVAVVVVVVVFAVPNGINSRGKRKWIDCFRFRRKLRSIVRKMMCELSPDRRCVYL